MKKKVNTETAETQVDVTEAVEEAKVQQEAPVKTKAAEPTDNVDAVLKMYPQYEKCYVSKDGFVYPENAPEYQRKDAVLYKNKYYKS